MADDREQCLCYKSLGYFQHISEIYGDLGEIAAGLKPGRENRDERIICANLGLAMDDMVTAIKIYKKAVENNFGTWLELYPPCATAFGTSSLDISLILSPSRMFSTEGIKHDNGLTILIGDSRCFVKPSRVESIRT